MAIYIGTDKKGIKKIYIGSSSGTGSVYPREVFYAYIGTSNGNKKIFTHEHNYIWESYDDDTVCTGTCKCGYSIQEPHDLSGNEGYYDAENDELWCVRCGRHLLVPHDWQRVPMEVEDSHLLVCTRCGTESIEEHIWTSYYPDPYTPEYQHIKECESCGEQYHEYHTWVYYEDSHGIAYRRCSLCDFEELDYS